MTSEEPSRIPPQEDIKSSIIPVGFVDSLEFIENHTINFHYTPKPPKQPSGRKVALHKALHVPAKLVSPQIQIKPNTNEKSNSQPPPQQNAKKGALSQPPNAQFMSAISRLFSNQTSNQAKMQILQIINSGHPLKLPDPNHPQAAAFLQQQQALQQNSQLENANVKKNSSHNSNENQKNEKEAQINSTSNQDSQQNESKTDSSNNSTQNETSNLFPLPVNSNSNSHSNSSSQNSQATSQTNKYKQISPVLNTINTFTNLTMKLNNINNNNKTTNQQSRNQANDHRNNQQLINLFLTEILSPLNSKKSNQMLLQQRLQQIQQFQQLQQNVIKLNEANKANSFSSKIPASTSSNFGMPKVQNDSKNIRRSNSSKISSDEEISPTKKHRRSSKSPDIFIPASNTMYKTHHPHPKPIQDISDDEESDGFLNLTSTETSSDNDSGEYEKFDERNEGETRNHHHKLNPKPEKKTAKFMDPKIKVNRRYASWAEITDYGQWKWAAKTRPKIIEKPKNTFDIACNEIEKEKNAPVIYHNDLFGILDCLKVVTTNLPILKETKVNETDQENTDNLSNNISNDNISNDKTENNNESNSNENANHSDKINESSNNNEITNYVNDNIPNENKNEKEKESEKNIENKNENMTINENQIINFKEKEIDNQNENKSESLKKNENDDKNENILDIMNEKIIKHDNFDTNENNQNNILYENKENKVFDVYDMTNFKKIVSAPKNKTKNYRNRNRNYKSKNKKNYPNEKSLEINVRFTNSQIEEIRSHRSDFASAVVPVLTKRRLREPDHIKLLKIINNFDNDLMQITCRANLMLDRLFFREMMKHHVPNFSQSLTEIAPFMWPESQIKFSNSYHRKAGKRTANLSKTLNQKLKEAKTEELENDVFYVIRQSFDFFNVSETLEIGYECEMRHMPFVEDYTVRPHFDDLVSYFRSVKGKFVSRSSSGYSLE